jgi:hypothetical protein
MNARRTRTPTPMSLVAYAIGFLASGLGIPSVADSAELPRCTLLTSAEVQEVIGRHDGGKSDLSNQWGLLSCRWTATSPAQGAPEGWYDAVEVAVFEAAQAAWARDQATGAPVEGLAKGAVYDKSYGDVWFDCGNGRFCAVKVRTASDTNRERNAKHFAQLVDSRLRSGGGN